MNNHSAHASQQLSSKLRKLVDAAIDAALGTRIVGCVVLVRERGNLVYARAAGLADREAGIAVKPDTIFRLASVTKPIVATAALRMMDDGLLSLDDPVTRFLPWFTPHMHDGSTPVITIRHLLSHTSGITYDVPEDVSPGLAGPIISLEENLRRLARVPLAFAPGQGWIYGMGIDVLGGVLAALSGGSLADAVATYVTRPLGMTDTYFHVTDPDRLAKPYADDAPPRLMSDPDRVHGRDGVLIFSPGRIFNREVPQSGGGGMAGTAADVMLLLEAYQPSSIFLKPATRELALSNHTPGLTRRPRDQGQGFGLIGAVVTDRVAAAMPCSNGTVNWGGVWGLSWLVDPNAHVSLLVCTNTALEGCNGAFASEIRTATFAA
jgi:CubicO group peptidase (beta-lactamase class C family)